MPTHTMPATVLITGATSGIGRAMAVALKASGCAVFATGRKQEDMAELLACANSVNGGALHVLSLDVTIPSSVHAMRNTLEVLLKGRPLDALINNAGFSNPGPLELVSDKDLRHQFEVNVFGLMDVTRCMLPLLRASSSARIINISSGMGRQAMPLHGAYNASKYALEALSDALRMELRSFGVSVVLVEPGTIRSGFADRAVDSLARYETLVSNYQPMLGKAIRTYDQIYTKAPEPQEVVDMVLRAMRADRPKARYIAYRTLLRITLLERLMPTSVADKIKCRAFGYPT